MSGDTTYQALKRLSWLPERDASQNGSVIAGQDYDDVYFIGGSAANLVLTNATINGVATARTETIITSPGNYTALASDYVITVNKTTPEITIITLPLAPTTSETYIVKDGAGNAASFNITITGNGKTIDGASSKVITNNFGATELIYNGTQWNVLNQLVTGAGTGTVTQVNTGTGLTGGPITNTGTISIANNTANTLAGFNASGVFSDVVIGGGLSLSGGTLSATAGAPAFNSITSGTNIVAAMVVGSGATLGATGSGTIAATSAPANALTGTLTSAQLAAYLTDETGTGVAVFSTSPTVTGISSNTYTSTVATGTAPFTVTSTTPVANLNIGGSAATVTTNANLTGPITSVGNATSIASQTGTGTKFVVDTSPTLITPTIGVATATSVNKVTITAPATSATLTLAQGSTLATSGAFSNTITTTGATTVTFPTTGTLYGTASGSITSAQLATSLSDETGSGSAVFATSPTVTGISSNTYTSTVATGTAPFSVTSTTPVANLSIGGNAAIATAANALNSATTTVVVNGATAPTTGQVLTATSGTAATWQSPSGGSAFSALTSSTNTTAAMVVGTGASLATSGSGTIAATTAATATAANALNSATTTVVVNAATAPTTGQVLTATSSTAATWQTPTGGSGMSIGGTVTSGTTGSVLFVGSGPVLAQDNSNYFYDSTNHNLGLGTATPNATNMIDMVSTTKSLGIPAMTSVQMNAIVSPRVGSMVYATDLAAPYCYTGSTFSAMVIPYTPAFFFTQANLTFSEAATNGSNKITLTVPVSIGSDQTLTLPEATDTLVGKATTDTLTNKTINAANNVVLSQGGILGTTASATSNTTLATLTGLTATLVAAGQYTFRVYLDTSSVVASGLKVALTASGGLTMTTYHSNVFAYQAASIAKTSVTTLGSEYAVTSIASPTLEIIGSFIVNAAGTVSVQFAQNVSGATATTVLAGSSFTVTRMA